MKYAILIFFLVVAANAFATPQQTYDDAIAKAQVDYRRAQQECKAMPEKERYACMKRTEQMWQQVHNGLKKQHLNK